MTDATTLKPCPFCAGEAAIGTGRNYYFVLCPDCLASTNVILAESIMPTEDEAIAAWNTRQPTQSDALREENLQLRSEMTMIELDSFDAYDDWCLRGLPEEAIGFADRTHQRVKAVLLGREYDGD
jgi:hypothetical protein